MSTNPVAGPASFDAKALRQKKCFIGFDAFVDIIARPILNKDGAKEEYFGSMADFAAHLTGNGETSKSVEVNLRCKKIGGNNPLMTQALASLGANVTSVGAYGAGRIDELFAPLAKKARLLPYADPGMCFSYEFGKSKLMTYSKVQATGLSLEEIERLFPGGALGRALEEADLIALLNYAEMPATLSLWRDIAARLPSHGRERIIFFDLSDITGHSPQSIGEVIEVMRAFQKYGRVCLSMNENEFALLYGTITGGGPPDGENADRAALLRLLAERVPADILILRALSHFYAAEAAGGSWQVRNFYTRTPTVLTGAGDNQNAGICAAMLLGLPMEEVLNAGVNSGRYYMENGACVPDWDTWVR